MGRMNSRVKLFPLAVSFLFFALAILCSQDMKVILYVRSVTQFFASGVSTWKTLFFLVYASAFFFGLALYKLPEKMHQSRLNLLFTSLGVAHLCGLFTHILFCREITAPFFSRRLIAVFDGALSSNSWRHLHTTKGGIALIKRALGIRLPMVGDSGDAFLGYLSPTVLSIQLFAQIVCVYFLAREIFPRAARALASKNHGSFACYWTLAFVAGKSIFDGGMLAPENVAALALLVPMLLNEDRVLKGLPMVALWLCLLLPLQLIEHGEDLLDWTLQVLRSVLTFSSLIVLCSPRASGSALLKFTAVLIPLASAWFLSWTNWWLDEFRYAQTEIPGSAAVYATLTRPPTFSYQEMFPLGQSAVYKFSYGERVKIIDVHSQLKLTPGYLAINIDGVTCLRATPFERAGVVRIFEGVPMSEDPFQASNSAVKRVVFSPRPGSRSFDFDYVVTFQGCTTNDSDSTVSYLFSSLGIRRFVLFQ